MAKEEIKREKLFESDPSFVEPVGKMGWDKESGRVFYLLSKDGKKKWGASL
ncbi:hypothetical protein [Chitinophaga agrisoli]|uniref:hypothetical protein n=1 Tax=Chitinophaga agrisoli TaxID=2607653 RepID=UPI001661D3E5|nr:hypothetical protein [Chitinophaga agrisoli]